MTREASAITGAVRTTRDSDEVVVWPDERLLRQFLSRSGETAEAAFAALIERHGPMVHRVCLDVLRSREESRDAAQAVFLVLARKAGSIRKPGSLAPWLHGVALRVARRARGEMIRRKVAEQGRAEILRRRGAAESGPEPMKYADLHEEVDRLPEKYRQPIILCYMQGRTQAEAAEALGWPLGPVPVRLHRGKERLRSRLTRRGAGLVGVTLTSVLASRRATAAAPGRAWAETTARAAVRLASGRGVAGLVAPGVSGLAESVTTAMLYGSWKVVASMVMALAFPLVAVGLASAIAPGDGGKQVAASEPGPKVDRIATAPVPQEAPAPVADKGEPVAMPPKPPPVLAVGFEPAQPPESVADAPARVRRGPRGTVASCSSGAG